MSSLEKTPDTGIKTGGYEYRIHFQRVGGTQLLYRFIWLVLQAQFTAEVASAQPGVPEEFGCIWQLS